MLLSITVPRATIAAGGRWSSGSVGRHTRKSPLRALSNSYHGSPSGLSREAVPRRMTADGDGAKRSALREHGDQRAVIGFLIIGSGHQAGLDGGQGNRRPLRPRVVFGGGFHAAHMPFN